MHNLLPGAFTDFFSLTSQSNPYNVRTSSNYRGIAIRTNTRKFSIKSAGPRTWNNLPVAIRLSSSISIFKKKLRHHLLTCLLYTSDAADERSSVDLGGRRII